MKPFNSGTRVEILIGNFKGLVGEVTGYREADKSYSVKLDNSHVDIRWQHNELKPIKP